MKLTTKPSAKFIGAVGAGDLEMIANFLNQIAKAQSKATASEKAAA